MRHLIAILAAAGAATAASTAPPPPPLTRRPPEPTFSPTLPEIQAAAAKIEPLSPTSNVKGKAFDRIVQIWLENTNFNAAAGDPNMQWLASQGILLTNYWAISHPSQPNYAAVAAGDHFGLDSGDFVRVPANVSTVVDLLDTRGISWAEYQESSPHPGFQGYNYSDQATFRNNYMRKHNPLIIFDSVTGNATRLRLIKNEASFAADVKNKTLPQWSFFTPNMLNDGHDTNVAFAAKWTRGLLEPLLSNEYFMNRTLVIVSFDESEVYGIPNNVYTVLLGGTIDPSLRGTKDETFYTHYSTISTVSANWELPSLGRWDCAANVLAVVANETGYRNSGVDTRTMLINRSYPGPLNNGQCALGWWPVPNTMAKCASGKGVLKSVVEAWGKDQRGSYDYTNVFPYDEQFGVETAAPKVLGSMDGGVGSPAGYPRLNVAGGARPGGVGWISMLIGLVAAVMM